MLLAANEGACPLAPSPSLPESATARREYVVSSERSVSYIRRGVRKTDVSERPPATPLDSNTYVFLVSQP